jgi:hypothetical protein
MRKVLFAGAFVAALSLGSVAHAAPVVFSTSGANGVSGTATFENISATQFTITLDNLTSPTSMTAQELDGLTYSLSGATGTGALVSVSAAAILDCGGDNTVPCDPYAGVVPTNDGWGVSTSSGVTTLTTTPLGFHPFAIINSNYELPSSGNGNLANGEHNPFLVGPVVFTFNGQFTGVSDVTFFWGTSPDTTTGTCTSGCTTTTSTTSTTTTTPSTVPEPGLLALLGAGLGAAAQRLRRRAA